MSKAVACLSSSIIGTCSACYVAIENSESYSRSKRSSSTFSDTDTWQSSFEYLDKKMDSQALELSKSFSNLKSKVLELEEKVRILDEHTDKLEYGVNAAMDTVDEKFKKNGFN